MVSIEHLYKKYKESGEVSTDTRKISPGSIFFALKGPNFNANELAGEALSKGASYAIVDEAKWVKDDRCILVDNSLQKLQQLARYHRDQLHIPVLGLTGSNGKTTTKELIYTILSTRYNTLATRGNLNNHIGVPLTILAINSAIEVAIIEMGANHVGEIEMLCKIANPTHGAITNIGSAHIGPFGGMDNIIRTKGELYHHLMHADQTVWVNSQSDILVKLSKQLTNPMLYPAQNDYFHCELVAANPFVKIKTEKGREVETHLIGEYNFENIALALCIAKFFKISEDTAVASLEKYKPKNMRSQVVIKGTNTLVLDMYNANPTSMEYAIRTLSQMKTSRKVAILGDMYELGIACDMEHLKIVALLKKYGIDEAYLCGDLFSKIAKPAHGIWFFPSCEALTAHLKHNPICHATILVKASRGMALENMLNFI